MMVQMIMYRNPQAIQVEKLRAVLSLLQIDFFMSGYGWTWTTDLSIMSAAL